MLNHQFLKPPQLLGREAEVPCEADWLHPEVGRQIIPVNMDMRRLMGFMAVEVEAVRAASQDRRHERSILPREGLARPQAVSLCAFEGPHPVGFADGDALVILGYHVAGEPLQRRLLFPLLAPPQPDFRLRCPGTATSRSPGQLRLAPIRWCPDRLPSRTLMQALPRPAFAGWLRAEPGTGPRSELLRRQPAR